MATTALIIVYGPGILLFSLSCLDNHVTICRFSIAWSPRLDEEGHRRDVCGAV